jgi:hypothetical protein
MDSFRRQGVEGGACRRFECADCREEDLVPEKLFELTGERGRGTWITDRVWILATHSSAVT